MKKSIAALLFVLLLSLAVALCGCGGGSEPPAAPSEGDAPAAAPPSEPTATGLSYDNWDNIIRMSVSGSPYADPGFGTDSVSAIMYVNVYDSLVVPNHKDEMVPSVATEWTTSEDGLTWTFKLRDDVKFHDGSDLTASDVAFSMNRLLTTGQGFAYLFVDYVESVEAVDDYTVTFTLKKTFAPFLSVLCRLYIVNEELLMANKADGSYGEFGDYGAAYLNTGVDAGSGAYYISDWQLQNRVCLTLNENYWGEIAENAPVGVEYVEGTETATVRAKFASGELDLCDQWQSTENFNALDAMEGVDVANISAGGILYIHMNNKKAPLDDIHVRKALAHLLDYDQAIDVIFPGTGRNGTVIPNGMVGFTKEGVTIYEYNMEKAAAELEQSKYYGSFDEYPINMTWIAEVADEEKLCLLLQAAASQVGLTIDITKTPHMTNVENVTQIETTPHMNVSFDVSDYGEAGSLLSIRFHSNNVGLYSQTEWLQDPKMDKMIDDALSTLDYDARMEKYAEAIRYAADLCACIPVGDQAKRHAYRADRFEWPYAEYAAAGQGVSAAEGYCFIFKDFNCLQ